MKVSSKSNFNSLIKQIIFEYDNCSNGVYIGFLYLATGTCLPIWGKKLGEHCYNDQDCESGFLCMGTGPKRTCQTPTPGDKLLGELKYKTAIYFNISTCTIQLYVFVN